MQKITRSRAISPVVHQFNNGLLWQPLAGLTANLLTRFTSNCVILARYTNYSQVKRKRVVTETEYQSVRMRARDYRTAIARVPVSSVLFSVLF